MKKKILSAILSVGAIVGLASCGVEPHEHSFAKEWSSNAGGHWHACECDDRLYDSFAAHVDANKDQKCDVCSHEVKVEKVEVEKPAHEHSFAEAWSNNAQGHWHACECDANLYGSFAAHVDANNDGKCDVCNFEVGKQHVHTYATEWSKDAANHWHESTCDHKVVDGKAPHTMGSDDKCTVCGYGDAAENVATLKSIDVNAAQVKSYYNIGETFSANGLVVYETYSNTLTADTVSVGDLDDYVVSVKDSKGTVVEGAFADYGTYTVTVSKDSYADSFEVTVGAKLYESTSDALTEGLENFDKVNGGTVVFDYGDDFVTKYEFAFGDKYTKIVENGDYENHYQILEDGSVFAISKYYDEYNLVDVYEPIYDLQDYHLNGVNLSNLLVNDYEAYGVKELLEGLISLSEDEGSQNYKEGFAKNCPVCGVHTAYTFSFDVMSYDQEVSYEVAFSIDDSTKVINNIEIKVSAISYDYDWETNEYVKPENAEPIVRLVTINQTVGERDAVNEYTPDLFEYTSFDLVDVNEEKVDNNSTIDMTVGEEFYLYISNAAPSTALASIDQVEVVAMQNDEEAFSAGGYYTYGNEIKLYAYKPGTYNFTINTKNVTYNLEVNVAYADLESFGVAVWDSNSYDYVEKDSVTVYPNKEVDFTSIVNDNANGAYTVKFAEEYANAKLEEGDDNNHLFSASAVGTYEVILTSVEDETMTKTLTVTVVEMPNVGDILVGTYKYTSNMAGTVTFVFTPESEGATSGVVAISAAGGYFGDSEGTFNYSYVDGTLTTTPTNPGSALCAYGFELNDNLEVVCTYNYCPQGVCSKVEDSSGDEGEGTASPIVGTHNTTLLHPMNGFEQSYQITFNADGTGSYNFQDDYEFGSFSYVFEDGNLTFSNIETSGSVVALTAVISGDSLSITYEFMVEEETTSNTVTFEVAGLSNSSDESEPSEGEIEVAASYYGTTYVYTAEETGTYTFSVDETVAMMGYNFEQVSSFSAYIEAGQEIEIVMLANDQSTNTVILTVEFEA